MATTSGTCIHGFTPGTCLICQTLDGGAATATRAEGGRAAKRSRRAERSTAVEPAAGARSVRPDAVYQQPPRQRRTGPGVGTKLVGFLVLALLVAIGVWIVAGLVLAVLHILELVLVAIVAGWLGWKAGVHHGRRTRT